MTKLRPSYDNGRSVLRKSNIIIANQKKLLDTKLQY